MNKENSSKGLGIMGVAFITLLVIKLVFPHSISWWVVTIPLFISTFMVLLSIIIISSYLFYSHKKMNKKKQL